MPNPNSSPMSDTTDPETGVRRRVFKKEKSVWEKSLGGRILGGLGSLFKGGKKATDIEVPEAPDVEGTLREPGEAAIDEKRAAEEGKLAAEEENQARAEGVAGEVRASTDEATGLMDDQFESVEEDQARLQENLGTAKEELEQIPDAVRDEFSQLRDEFDTKASTAFGRIDTQREETMGDVMKGQSMAAQAAIQGIQGNINNQVAQIQGNNNLTAGQKQNMIAQVKLAGASAIAPAIGATQLQFNTLAANTATSFAGITGSIQNQVLSSQGQLIGMSGEAYSQAKVAVGQMTNQLLEIDANSSVAFANSQTQLLGMRTQAEMTGNDLLLRLLPEQGTPYADFSESANMRVQFENEIMMKGFTMELQSTSADAMIAMIESMQGSPLKNALMGAIQGFATGGPGGAAMGAAGGFLGSQ